LCFYCMVGVRILLCRIAKSRMSAPVAASSGIYAGLKGELRLGIHFIVMN
jgi:hypothetical protein